MIGEKGGRETWDMTGEEEEADIEERGEERDPLIPQLSSKPQLASTCLTPHYEQLSSGQVFIVSTREILIAFCNQKFT